MNLRHGMHVALTLAPCIVVDARLLWVRHHRQSEYPGRTVPCVTWVYGERVYRWTIANRVARGRGGTVQLSVRA